MSKKEKPVYEHPWLDPKYDRPRRWPIIAVTFTVVILAALGTWLFFRYGLSARLTPTLVPTEVTITATTTVSPTPTVATPSPSTTEPDPEPPIVPDQPEPTHVPPVVETYAPAPAPVPPVVAGNPPVIHGFTCVRDGQSFNSQVSFNAYGAAGNVTITIGPVNLPNAFSAGTTSASASAMISAHSQACTATITTSYGTISASTQSN